MYTRVKLSSITSAVPVIPWSLFVVGQLRKYIEMRHRHGGVLGDDEAENRLVRGRRALRKYIK
jgi:hypothetical protein